MIWMDRRTLDILYISLAMPTYLQDPIMIQWSNNLMIWWANDQWSNDLMIWWSNDVQYLTWFIANHLIAKLVQISYGIAKWKFLDTIVNQRLLNLKVKSQSLAAGTFFWIVKNPAACVFFDSQALKPGSRRFFLIYKRKIPDAGCFFRFTSIETRPQDFSLWFTSVKTFFLHVQASGSGSMRFRFALQTSNPSRRRFFWDSRVSKPGRRRFLLGFKMSNLSRWRFFWVWGVGKRRQPIKLVKANH